MGTILRSAAAFRMTSTKASGQHGSTDASSSHSPWLLSLRYQQHAHACYEPASLYTTSCCADHSALCLTSAFASSLQTVLPTAVRILSTEGVSLTSLQASFLSSSTPWETSLYFQQLTELLTLVHDDKGQHMLDAFSQQVLQDTSYTTTHSIRDQGDRKVGPTTAEGTPSTTAAGAWSLQTATEEQRHKIWAPWIIRHWLAHSLQPLQLCGLVGQPRVKQALQGLLSFVDYQHLAVQPGAAAGPVLSLLPAAVRAWILADVAAGLLLADDNGSR